MGLGQVDYGLYGVVGGLTVFISFLNGVLAYSIGRFYALAVGKMKRQDIKNTGIDECRKWFSIAVVIHTLFPCVLMIIGYPIGNWMIKSFLVIPLERMNACIWVFRFVCVACFFSMVTVPYQAMYTAKQRIAELSIYSVITTTLNFIFMLYMVRHPGCWLTKYALWMCLMAVIPNIVIAIRATFVFEECQFAWRYCCLRSSYMELFAYTGWQFWGSFGSLMRGQGIAILINKYFGPSVNAAMTLGNQVNAHASSLATAMQGAYMPAILTSFGSGNMEEAKAMALRACKFGTILMLIFVVPLSVELKSVLHLWLENPPAYTDGLCLCMMLCFLLNNTTVGHMILVHATGRIATYQALLGGALIATLPIAWVLIINGLGVYSICYAMIAMSLVCAWGRVFFTRKYVSLPIRVWFVNVLLPVLLLIIVALTCAKLVQLLMPAGFLRIVVVTACSNSVLLLLCWYLVLDCGEREFVKMKLKERIFHDR